MQYKKNKKNFILEAFENSWMFPDLKQAGKKPVLNAGTELGPGRECSRMLGMGNGIRERRPLPKCVM